MIARVVAAAALVGFTTGAAAAAPCASTRDVRAAERAATWLSRQPISGLSAGQLADSIVALRATGRRPAALRGRVRRLARTAPGYARTPGAAAKVVLAVRAVGGDPRRFGRTDYLRRITSGYASGRFGASAYDQALSMLALRASGRPVPPAAVVALRRAQGQGGWGFELRPADTDQVDATGLILEALAASGVRPSDTTVTRAVRWMLTRRERTGGFAVQGGRLADANSTASAWRGLCASRRPVPATTRAFLRSLQQRDGRLHATRTSGGSSVLAVNDAIIALRGRTLPLR
ncbi:MAG: hypothetical protein KDC36_03875 [Thermoleophilia bacterium]|nr:hypothetical protein [Thermoleophilia bacterium]